jgi:hypothetical protein
MILAIASELINEDTCFVPFNKAQEIAEKILDRIEKEGKDYDACNFWEEE